MIRALGWASWMGLALTLSLNARAALDEGSKQAVRSLANEAAKDFEQGQYESAQAKFERAYGIAKVPRLAVWLARTHEKRGELVAAYELYRQALSLKPNELWTGDAQQQAQNEAEQALTALTPRLAKLTVRVEGELAGVVVTIDGLAVPSALLGLERFADPGKRRIVAERGAEHTEQSVTLAEGTQQEVVLKFEGAAAITEPEPGGVPAPSPPSSVPIATTSPPVSPQIKANPLRTAGWVGIGVGAAGVGLGVVTGAIVGSKYSTLKTKCPGHTCPPDNSSEVSSYNSLRTVSTVGFIAGAVVAAAGVTLVLTHRSEEVEPKPSVALWLSPGMAEVRGRF